MKNETEILDEAIVGAARWHGAVDGIYKQLVYGWVFDRTRPDARVIVEICRDDVPFACILADVARTDLQAELKALGAPDLCHGFVADLGALPASAGGVISARVANTEVTLTGSFRLEEPKTPPAAAINTVVGDGGLRLHGWALDPADQKRTVTVRAFVGQEMVAQAAANIIHPSMRGYVDGAHGFDLALPASLADGAVHSVRVVDDEGRPLNGSPLTICCSMDGLVGLLPDDADELLLKVADIYQRHLPRSLPMSAWPEWSARFDREGPAILPTLTTAVIVTGDTDAAALERTLTSLQSQHGMTVQAFSGQPFAALLAQALESNCDVICCVRAGDTLAPHALAWALEGFALPEAQVVYTDSETNGTPWFKPAWNPDYALASDYPLDLLLVHSTVAQGLLDAHDAADFAWAALTAAWSQGSESIIHVPRVLLRKALLPDAAEHAARLTAATRALSAIWPEAVLEELDGVPPGSAHAARRVGEMTPEFAAPEWADGLRRQGIEWRCDAVAWGGNAASYQTSWNDYHDTDVVLAMRKDVSHLHVKKPASKLINAWLAGVPAILGPEQAYRELRRSPLDYIEVASAREAGEALARLASEPALYQAMVENGLRRGEEVRAEACTRVWAELLFYTIPARRRAPAPLALAGLGLRSLRCRLRAWRTASPA